MKNIETKSRILKEQYSEYCSNSMDENGDGLSFEDYVMREIESDKDNFLFWFYDGVIPADEEQIQNDIVELINY